MVLIFLLLIPTQLGKYFWFDFSFVNGLRVDYLALSVYLVDILAFLIVLINFRKIEFKKWGWWWLFLLLGIITALDRNVAVLGLFRLTLVLMVMSVLRNFAQLKKYLGIIIPFWVFLEVFLALGQIILGRNLGGFFYFLGERRLDINTIGTAQISFFGRSLLRAYGTFSHPNSMAGFFVIVAYLWQKYDKNYFWWIVWWLIVLLIVLTGSRVAILVFLLFFGKWLGFIVIVLGFFLIKTGVFGGWDVLSWEKRIDLMLASGRMFLRYPLFGVGWNNFLKELPNFSNIKWIQPVHNIFLLILSQLGIINSFVLIKALKKIIGKTDWRVVFLVGFLGFFDHYFLTLPQNIWILMFAIILR